MDQRHRSVGRRVSRRPSFPSLLVLAALLAACLLGAGAPAGAEAAKGPAKIDSFTEGMSHYRAGNHASALPLLLDHLSKGTNNPQFTEAALAVARIYNEQKRYDEGLKVLERVPRAQRGPEARYLHGVAEIKVGRVEEGIVQLKALDESKLTPADRIGRLEALADGSRYLGRWMESLFFFNRFLQLAPDPEMTKGCLRQTGELIANQLSDEQLAEAIFLFNGSAIGQQAGLERAERLFQAGQTHQALNQVAKVLQDPRDFPGRERAVQLRQRLAGDREPNRILGVILPLSGRYASFGKRVQRGIELAALEQASGEQAVQLVFRDSGADPETSARAVSELANVDQVLGILGPLTGNAAGSAAERAELEKVPLLTLSQRRGLAETGPQVFRNSLTNEQQARTLVRYAMEERNMTTFAILAPDSRLGKDLSAAFIHEVEAHGGRVVARQTYSDKATDFRRQIKLLKGEDPDAPEQKPDEKTEGAVEEEEELPFEALFIPDYAERIGLIAPQLPFYGLRGVQLLGINGWNSPELLSRSGAYVEGAVFVDGFFRSSDYPFVKDFVNRCFEKFGEEPTILEAQGYDAAGILLSLAGRADVRSREDLRNALSILRDYPGVTGATSFDPDGDARKVLFLLQVQKGNIVQIN